MRLGLLQKIKLPTSIDCLPVIEKLIISLLRVEVRYSILFTLVVFLWFYEFLVFF